jgi:hypothetical protein
MAGFLGVVFCSDTTTYYKFPTHHIILAPNTLSVPQAYPTFSLIRVADVAVCRRYRSNLLLTPRNPPQAFHYHPVRTRLCSVRRWCDSRLGVSASIKCHHYPFPPLQAVCSHVRCGHSRTKQGRRHKGFRLMTLWFVGNVLPSARACELAWQNYCSSLKLLISLGGGTPFSNTGDSDKLPLIPTLYRLS